MWQIRRQKRDKLKHRLGDKSPLSARAHRTAEQEALDAFTPPYRAERPDTITSPLLLASPHSGRLYPKPFLDQTRLSRDTLRLSEDCYVDRIFTPLTEMGIPFLQALFPRCFVDVNRSETEWPPEANPKTPANEISPRAKAGLGVIPTRIAQDLNIYSRPLRAKCIQARLDALYHPYHNALREMIAQTKAAMGHAVLLDCHSMPGVLASGQKRADIILGDRFRKSCQPETIDIVQEKLQALGYNVTRNIPYAGGFVTAHYGRPNMGVEAIQIEINKDLYLNPHTLEPTEGMEKLSQDMYTTIAHLHDTLKPSTRIAAQ